MRRLRRPPFGLAAALLILLSVASAGAGTITLDFTFSPNTTIKSAEVNSNFSKIYNEFNGNISDANVSALSEGKVTFSGTGHDHSGGTKGALVAHPEINGRLQFNSTTQIKFCPFQGNRLFIKKSGVWTATTISSSCITANNTSIFLDGTGDSNLAASTTYFVYLFDNSGTTTVDYSTTGHATDATTGVEIKSGVDTRVLIGMVRTNGSSQFQDDNGLRGVLSYFNRRAIALVNSFSTNRSTTSATYVELNSEIRGNFLTWGDEAVLISGSGAMQNNGAAGSNTRTSIGIDGATAEDVQCGFDTTGTALRAPVGLTLYKNGLSEGFHFATLLGLASSGTSTWDGGGTAGTRTTLTVRIKG